MLSDHSFETLTGGETYARLARLWINLLHCSPTQRKMSNYEMRFSNLADYLNICVTSQSHLFRNAVSDELRHHLFGQFSWHLWNSLFLDFFIVCCCFGPGSGFTENRDGSRLEKMNFGELSFLISCQTFLLDMILYL